MAKLIRVIYNLIPSVTRFDSLDHDLSDDELGEEQSYINSSFIFIDSLSYETRQALNLALCNTYKIIKDIMNDYDPHYSKYFDKDYLDYHPIVWIDENDLNRFSIEESIFGNDGDNHTLCQSIEIGDKLIRALLVYNLKNIDK